MINRKIHLCFKGFILFLDPVLMDNVSLLLSGIGLG